MMPPRVRLLVGTLYSLIAGALAGAIFGCFIMILLTDSEVSSGDINFYIAVA